MNIESNIKLVRYADGADSGFSAAKKRIEGIEEQVTRQLGGRTNGSLSRAVLSPIIYSSVLLTLFIIGFKYMLNWLAALALVVSLAFAVVMFVDAMSKKTYYSSVFRYMSKMTALKNDIAASERSVSKTGPLLLAQESKGWEYQLPMKPSILDGLGQTTDQLGKLRTAERGGLKKLQMALYYASAILNTLAGATALLKPAGEFIDRIFAEHSLSDSLINGLTLLGVALVVVGVIILARLIWAVRLRVTGPAMLFTLTGPAIYFIFMLLMTLLVFALIWVISIVIALAVGAIGLFVLCACCGGG